MQQLLQRLPRNDRGRDLVIGDIHGQFSRVERELDRLGFDPGRDRLICVGDLVDRGPESELAAEWLAQPWFFAVMGNHDASLLQRVGLLGARFELWHDHHDWLDRLAPRTRDRLVEALAALPWALEFAAAPGLVGVVHAEVPAAYASWQTFVDALGDERVRSAAISNREQARQADDLGAPGAGAEGRLAGLAWVIHGHTPRRYCRPGQRGNRLWIDTMGWYDRPVQYGEARYTIVDAAAPLTPL